jgi:hypothetical protein
VTAGVEKPGRAPCRLCAGDAVACGRQRLLGRHDAFYFRCPTCDLIQTQTPTWLAEAYGAAIAATDTGAIERNRVTARLTFLTACLLGLGPEASCLDYGGGHGVFVRMMRDLGLDFRWSDRFASNIYARGFAGDPGLRHELVTAFEVFEHFVDARAELTTLFGPRHRYILVGTLLHDGFQPDWWYLARESGQYVAFFSRRTMAWVAEHFGYDVEIGPANSLFIAKGAPLGAVRRTSLRALVANARLAFGIASLVPEALLGRVGRFRSRIAADYAALIEEARAARVADIGGREPERWP